MSCLQDNFTVTDITTNWLSKTGTGVQILKFVQLLLYGSLLDPL